jgi:hypothetical protein
VKERYGTDGLTLLFADTLGEDRDLYRFLIEGSACIFGVLGVEGLAARCERIPRLWEREARRAYLMDLAKDAMDAIPGLVWLADGRDIHQVFMDEHMLGSPYAAQCSRELKQKVCRKWMKGNCAPEATTVHVGIDWTEIHRLEAIVKAWEPFPVDAPMCDEPYLDKTDMLDVIEDRFGIRRPALYAQGYAHNNCSGFCVRSGQAQMRLLLQTRPDEYRFHEEMEQQFRQHFAVNAAFMKERSKITGHNEPLTLAEFRRRIENQPTLFDADDWGGCGCFVDSEAPVDIK